MLVPGISGGSMAMILGIYDELISSVSSFFQEKKKHFFFLFCFSIGAILGIGLFANPLSYLIDRFPMPTMYFFIGAVTGGIPLICRQAKIRSFTLKIPLWILLGAAVVLGISMIPASGTGIRTQEGMASFCLLFLSGFIAAIALILPGISVSYVLLLIGLYNETMEAISNFYLPFLIPMIVGLGTGIILMAKLLEKALTRYPQTTHLMILGFLLGSVVTIFPGIPTFPELLCCVPLFFVGFTAIYLLSWRKKVK